LSEACSPLVVHHTILATVGGPLCSLLPINSTLSHCIPGTKMGRPPGGLKKPGLMRLRRAALEERTAHNPSNLMLSDFSTTLSSHKARICSPCCCSAATRCLALPHKNRSMTAYSHLEH